MARLTPEREMEIREDRRKGILEPGAMAELLNELDALRVEQDAARMRNGEMMRLPDGSGVFTASYPLPKNHWLYADAPQDPPMPMRVGVGPKRNELADQIRDAARHAIRASTMNGAQLDFDPDAMVQNMIIGLLGYWTEDGRDRQWEDAP